MACRIISTMAALSQLSSGRQCSNGLIVIEDIVHSCADHLLDNLIVAAASAKYNLVTSNLMQ